MKTDPIIDALLAESGATIANLRERLVTLHVENATLRAEVDRLTPTVQETE